MNMHSPRESLDLGRSLLRALRNTGIMVIYQDLDLRVLWSQNVPDAWSKTPIHGKSFRDFLPVSEADRLHAAKAAVLKTGRQENVELRFPVKDGHRWFEVWVDADRDRDGRIDGILTTAVEITEQKRREQSLKVLLRELSHRTKNLLSIIQSIATQTGRFTDHIDTFLAHFRGRLHSLSSSQDLITSSNWRGANLRELVTGQLSRYAQNPDAMIDFEGDDPFLNPNAALHIGLAIHELAVNSMSYGALSVSEGRVRIAAHGRLGEDGSRELLLTWQEEVHDGTAAFERKSFGSIALQRVVPASLSGSAQIEFGDGKLVYSLVVPAGSFISE